MKQVICITTSKGGAAKTTNTFEIAGALKSLKKKVLVIDMDQTCALSNFAGVKYTPEERIENEIKSSFDLIAGQCSINEAILELDAFDIIVGDERYAKAESIFTEDDDPYILKTLLDSIDDDEYDYIFIDHGPQNDIIKKMCYIATDSFILTTFKSESDRDEIKKTIYEILRLQKQRNNNVHGEIICCILARNEATSLTEVAYEELDSLMEEYNKERHIKPSIFTIRKSIKFEENQTYKVPYSSTHKSAPASRDVYKIVDFIINVQ